MTISNNVIVTEVRPVIWVSEPLRRTLCERTDGTAVSSVKEFLDATRDPKTVSFVDAASLATVASIDHVTLPGPIIGVCEESLQTAVGWLQYPWLSHVVNSAMVEHPMAEQHLKNVLRALTGTSQLRLLDWLEPTVIGRRVRLTHSNKRVARLERMREFFEGKKVGNRTLELLQDVAEELLTNAFYDAPVAAGALKPVPRTEDVALPDDSACDLAYGCRDDLAILRVRDPFGALTRRRLVEVLSRCARTDMTVEVDETMGGAGLGLWRIFSGASFVAISVLKNRHTEFLVGVAKRSAGPRPFAFHLFFKDSGKRRLSDKSVVLASKPK
ncbi:MAG: hypothetical protein H0T79_19650 [Deltaproteobacteria bacterium]|nr:hypothetical protein [Deltaproteobacteria bacterium]